MSFCGFAPESVHDEIARDALFSMHFLLIVFPCSARPKARPAHKH